MLSSVSYSDPNLSRAMPDHLDLLDPPLVAREIIEFQGAAGYSFGAIQLFTVTTPIPIRTAALTTVEEPSPRRSCNLTTLEDRTMISGRPLASPDRCSPTESSQAVRAPAAVVLHAHVPGRVRIHIPGWGPVQRVTLERRLSMVPGVQSARATPSTGNVLLIYDPATTDPAKLLRSAETALAQPRTPNRSGGRPRLLAERRRSRRPAPLPSRSIPLLRALLHNLPAVLGLILSLLSCTTPIGAARLGLKAVELAIQIGGATA
jgi:hypothetical protein